ncbi:MAG: hypothetical protein AB7D38_12270 [Sulfurimonas sp.]|uniref:hypothetical protein n=1 Tax=Sulfurimonas sp. TaxID=2022749 RepID=UPI003D11B5AB
MDELNCSAKLDRDANKIAVSNLADSELEISISGDVDFTNLVQELTKKIDEEKIIVLTVEDEVSIIDPKDKLIIETLKNIFDSYNESLQDIEEVSNDNNEDEIPF